MPRRPPPRRFFGVPTLGGRLTILNCLAWAALMLTIRHFQPHGLPAPIEACLIACGLLVSLHLATWYWLPQVDGGPNLAGLILMSTVTGLNAIVWGYGLAALHRRATRPPAAHDPRSNAPTPPEPANSPRDP